MIKKIITVITLSLCLSFIAPQPGIHVTAQTTTETKVKAAKELEKYLKKNFSKLKTNAKTFDLKNHIRVIENEDITRCFDIAIIIDWSAIEDTDYEVRRNIKYTKAQKKAFDKALKAYQKKMADAVTELFPDKKIRGGFLDYGYAYPYLQDGYYEGAVYGWRNYDYVGSSGFPFYEDTEVGEFTWTSFNDIDDPFDQIGLY